MVMEWLSPNFQRPLAAKLCVRRQKVFGGSRTCSRSSVTVPILVGLGFHPLPGGQKRRVFLSVYLSRFWTSEFVRPLSSWRRWTTETILIPLGRGRFVVVHLCSTFSDLCQLATPLNAEVQKPAKLGFFAAKGRQNKPIETKFGK